MSPIDVLIDMIRALMVKLGLAQVKPFKIVFRNGATLECSGGMDESGAWRGSNVGFAHWKREQEKDHG